MSFLVIFRLYINFIKHTIWDRVFWDFGGRGAVCGKFWFFGRWGNLKRRLGLRTSSASWAYGFLGGRGRERKEKNEMEMK